MTAFESIAKWWKRNEDQWKREGHVALDEHVVLRFMGPGERVEVTAGELRAVFGEKAISEKKALADAWTKNAEELNVNAGGAGIDFNRGMATALSACAKELLS